MFSFLGSFKARLHELSATTLALAEATRLQGETQARIEEMLRRNVLTSTDFEGLSLHFRRNALPNDDAAIQKCLIAAWRAEGVREIDCIELSQSGFRVFSQNDEDGILLRLFTQIGSANRFVIEIGSNCSGSDVGIPENLSTNLIVNHGWHGAIFEMDETECDRMRYFFAREFATRHFHWVRNDENTYFSPVIIQGAINAQNINDVLLEANPVAEPDLLVIDIDGGDYAVIENLKVIKPRVIVVEFERRFRERYSVVQNEKADYSRHWEQSGAASLAAWNNLLGPLGYMLCAIGSCGFNAFFVRSTVAKGKLSPLAVVNAFDSHPVFSRLTEDFWQRPDETWREV